MIDPIPLGVNPNGDTPDFAQSASPQPAVLPIEIVLISFSVALVLIRVGISLYTTHMLFLDDYLCVLGEAFGLAYWFCLYKAVRHGFSGHGKIHAAIVTWVNDDHDEGRKFVDQIASLGNCAMNMTEAKTATKYAEDNEKLMAYGVYGRSYTVNPKKWTPASMSALAKYSQSVPGGNAMISIHSLRSPKPNENCVFGAREDHHMIEIVSMTCDSALKDGTAAAYISLLDFEDADLKEIYGGHLETLVSLKRKYDPQNVFKHAPPKISV